MGDLHLALLGSPEVRHDGQKIAFRTRKVMALLIYMAVEGGLHSREKLTALFWPESDEPRGRMLLRRTLLLLRQSLREEDRSPQLAHIIVERDALGCNFSSGVYLDLQAVQQKVQPLREETSHIPRNAPQSEISHAVVAQLQAAASLYRGNFLDGFYLEDAPDFDDWMRLQRQAWHTRINLVFDRLSLLQSQRGEIVDAIEIATRWVAYEPLNETVYQRLMQLYLVMGNRDGALRTYESCRKILSSELRAKPAPETEALYERTRMTAGLSSSSSLPRSAGHKTDTVSSPTSMLVEGPLVGRTDEYARLVELYYQAKQERTQVVMLKGEAGIGKTRLANEFLRWAAAQGADVLQGRAFETGGRLSYQPLVESLRSRIEQENAPDDLLSDTWLAELSRLLPELRDRYPDLPAPESDEATARNRLFEAVARLGQALAERTPVVLFIDDVQWADAATLDLLHYLGRCWAERGTSLVLLMSIRTEALVNSGLITQWTGGLEHDLPVTYLHLSVLQHEDTLRLVQALGKGENGTEAEELAQFAQWLFAETGGQPFYMIEMLKALLGRNVLVSYRKADGSWVIDFSSAASSEIRLRGLLPASVREVIRSRLTQLSTGAFALLAAGAILGQGFTFERVCRVADLRESEGLPALDEVLMSQVLQEAIEKGEEALYFFAHDKIRDVIYTEAGDARRRIFHRRALEILEREQAPPAKLAHHALAAGLKEPAFRFSVAAGDSALELFAVRDAIAYYEQSRRILQEQGDRVRFQANIPALLVHHLYERLGRAYELNSEWEQVSSIYQAMLTLARESHFPEMECMALNRLATLSVHKSFDLEQAMSLLQLALQVAESSSDTAGLAETEWGLAQLNNYRFDAQGALTHGNRALDSARKLRQQDLIARCLNVCAHACLMLGSWLEAEGLAREASGLYRKLGNRPMESDCLCQVAMACISDGRYQDGLEVGQEAFAISKEIENYWGQVNCNCQLAMGSLEAGAFSEALAYAQQAVTLSRTQGVSILLNASLTILGRVLRTIFDLHGALAVHLEIIEATKVLFAHTIEMTATELCVDYALSGQWNEAHIYAVQALDNRLNSPFLYMGLTRWYETEALVRAGEIERAVEDVRLFETYFGKSRRHRIPYLRSLAVLAHYRGETDLAIVHLREAAKLAKEIGLPGELWLIWAALADLYLKQGKDELVRYSYSEAARLVHTLAATIRDDQRRKTFLSSLFVQRVQRAVASREGSASNEHA